LECWKARNSSTPESFRFKQNSGSRIEQLLALASCLLAQSFYHLCWIARNIVIIGGGVCGLCRGTGSFKRWSLRFLVEADCPSLAWARAPGTAGDFTQASTTSPGSLKARFCVAGKQRLHEFCAKHGVPHRNCVKTCFLFVCRPRISPGQLNSNTWPRKRAHQRRRRSAAGGPRRRTSAGTDIEAVRRSGIPSTGNCLCGDLGKTLARIGPRSGKYPSAGAYRQVGAARRFHRREMRKSGASEELR